MPPSTRWTHAAIGLAAYRRPVAPDRAVEAVAAVGGQHGLGLEDARALYRLAAGTRQQLDQALTAELVAGQRREMNDEAVARAGGVRHRRAAVQQRGVPEQHLAARTDEALAAQAVRLDLLAVERRHGVRLPLAVAALVEAVVAGRQLGIRPSGRNGDGD